jgi:hypothetical protein
MMRAADIEANQRLHFETLAPTDGASRLLSVGFSIRSLRERSLVAIPAVAAALPAGLLISNESKPHSGFLIEIACAVLIIVYLEVSNRTSCSCIQHAVYRSLVVAEMLQLCLSATNKVGGNIERAIVASLLSAGPDVTDGNSDSSQELHRHFGSCGDLGFDAMRKKRSDDSETTTDRSTRSGALSTACHCTDHSTSAGASSNKDGVASG